ncbi:unnamed protein product [Gordionus sp. m RMFG-2023]
MQKDSILSEESDEDDSENVYYNIENNFSKMERDFEDLWKKCSIIDTNLENNTNIPKIELDRVKLYLQFGMLYEKDNNINDALDYYRKSIHIVPDIDIQVSKALSCLNYAKHENIYSNIKEKQIDDKIINQLVNTLDQTKIVSDILNLNIREEVKKATIHNKNKCLILNKLPKEILIYIFKLVLSYELNVKYVENLAKVCKNFYLCARDEQLWFKACSQLWSVNTITFSEIPSNCHPSLISSNKYKSWKDMIVNRPHPRFDGWYISKTSYWRYGQSDFSPDSSCLPCYSVNYYRYFKFFSPSRSLKTSTVWALHSLEAPNLMLPKLMNCNLDIIGNCHATSGNPLMPGLMAGSYHIHADLNETTGNQLDIPLESIDIVVIVSKKSAVLENSIRSLRIRNAGALRTGASKANKTFNVSTYYMKFGIQKNAKGQPNRKLQWKQYSLLTKYGNGNKSKTVFDISQDKYPPLFFVSNYHFANLHMSK